MAAATGALVSSVAVLPAMAADDNGGDDGTTSASQPDGGGPDKGRGDRGDRDPRRYQGVVTAHGGVWLHDRPDRGSRRVRFVAQGETVTIYCKAGGAGVDGNPRWYMLTGDTWAWVAARYIDNVGPAPRWC
jgi:hypothetical protein